ncbi:hypothetical protein D3C72_1364230 [compost metagenome]
MRAIVEGQYHRLRRQVAAEDLAVAVLHRHRVRLDHAVVAQDRFAAVVLVQVRDVVVPLLALQFDGTGALEAAEDAGQFLVVVALDLVQRLQVFANALVQLHRRQRGISADAFVQITQHLAERKAIGIEQFRRRLDVIQHRAQGSEALRAATTQQRVELRGNGAALFQAIVEQLLADAGGGGAIGRGLLFLIGQQHDDPAIAVELLLQCAQQRCCRRVGGSGSLCARLGNRRRCLHVLVAAAGHEQGQQQAGQEQTERRRTRHGGLEQWGMVCRRF